MNETSGRTDKLVRAIDIDYNRIALADTEWTRMGLIVQRLTQELTGSFVRLFISPLIADHRRTVRQVHMQYRARNRRSSRKR